jgi:hypothetical protein
MDIVGKNLFSTVVAREKARRCPFYASTGFLYAM